MHDINKGAAEEHPKMGAAWADTPKDVAAASEVVFTSLPGPPEEQAVVLGENGLHRNTNPS